MPQPQLVILGWDYEYNYGEILHERERASKREWHTKIISMADLDSFAGKILFYDKPYLRLLKPEIHQTQAEKFK
jgi:hypothetical protein